MATFRIFTPAEARSQNEKREAQDKDRAQRLADTTKEILKEKGEAERDFEESMARQRKEQEAWEEEVRIRKSNLLGEITLLEQRKERALIPLTSREAIIKSAEDALRQRESEVEKREADVADSSRRLMAKLDAVYTREEDVKMGEKRLESRKRGIEAQAAQVMEGAKALNERIETFAKYAQEKEDEFAYTKSELDARKNLYDENDKRMTERERQMKLAQERLQDTRTQISQQIKISNKK